MTTRTVTKGGRTYYLHPGEFAPGEAHSQAHDSHGNTAVIHLHLDSTKVAEAVIRNALARRAIAESVAIYAQGMTARK